MVRARPNVLLLFPDQWRSDWDGQHSGMGIPLKLPTLRSLQNGGTRFTEAYVPSPSCAPSRASLSSGREYDRNGVLGNDANDYDSRIPTYYSALQEAGYWTMTAGRDDLTKHSWLGYRLGQDASNGSYRMTELGFSDGIRCIGKIENLHLWPQPFGTCTRLELLTLLIGARPAHLGPFSVRALRAIWPLPGRADGVASEWHQRKRLGRALRLHAPLARARSDLECGRNALPAHDLPTSVVSGRLDRGQSRGAAAPRSEGHAVVSLGCQPPRISPSHRPCAELTKAACACAVSFPGPHPPFVVTAPMAKSVLDRDWPDAVDDAPQRHHHRSPCDNARGQPGLASQRCNYAAEIENLDVLFDRILDAVNARSERANTVVVVSSDHGELLNDHHDFGKNKPWQGAIKVPLLWFGPGIRADVTIRVPVATLDISATILDFAGAQMPEGMESRSLRGLLERGGDPDVLAHRNRSYVHSGLQHLASDHAGAPSLPPMAPLPFELDELTELPRPAFRLERLEAEEGPFSFRLVVGTRDDWPSTFKFVCCFGVPGPSCCPPLPLSQRPPPPLDLPHPSHGPFPVARRVSGRTNPAPLRSRPRRLDAPPLRHHARPL